MRLCLLAVLVACDSSAQIETPFSSTDAAIKLEDLPIRLTSYTAGKFEQDVDHPYQPTAERGPTFQQRYWYNTEYADNENSPVLLEICGEAECSAGELSFLADSAKALHASIVTLEHRYYGKSLPFPDLTLEHMQYLHMHNALEDLATFQRWAMVNLPLKGKWIAQGGSYPGMLAAFYRLKHPELVVGAWAASAPVAMQRSFWGYDAIVSKALGPVCTLLMRQVLAAAGKAYEDEAQRSQIIHALGYDGWVPDSKTSFLSTFTYAADGAAQYGSQQSLCTALNQYATDPLKGFLLYTNPPLVPDDPVAPTGATGSTNEFAAAPRVPMMHSRPPSAEDQVTFDGSEWYYQTCSEVGFFQVHNPDRTQSVDSDEDTEEYQSAQCMKWVGKLPDTTLTRERYYNPIARGEASNILFVNSSADPWSSLSFIDPTHAPAGTVVYVVQDGSHCSDMYLTRDSLLGAFEVHKLFYDLAKTWLK